MPLDELIISAAKWLVAVGMGVYGFIEAVRLYNKRKEEEAKQKSVGEEALKKVNEKIDLQEKRITKLESDERESKYKEESLTNIIKKLEDDYTGLMKRLLDSWKVR